MSLTSHLSRATDPVSIWLRTRFPLENRRHVVHCCYRSKCDEVELELLRPWRDGGDLSTYPYNLIGTAFDYRARLYFDTLPKNTIAYKGAYRMRSSFYYDPPRGPSGKKSVKKGKQISAVLKGDDGADKPERPNAAIEFFRSLRLALARLQPTGRILETAEEEELARYCIVLGLWEQIVRGGPWINSPLWIPEPKKSVAAMLDIASPEMVADMCQLSRRFFVTCNDLIELGSRVIQNPTFKGSPLVGGADADLIADGCLWDIKCTKQTRASGQFRLEGEWIYQLLGYVLLDFDDIHGIREVGIYLARSGVRAQWPLQDLLNALTGTADSEALPLEEQLLHLRKDFRSMLEEEWARHTIISVDEIMS